MRIGLVDLDTSHPENWIPLERELGHDTDTPPLPFDNLLEPELCALAARQSWLEGDREVTLAELRESDEGYNGHAFAEGYRQVSDER